MELLKIIELHLQPTLFSIHAYIYTQVVNESLNSFFMTAVKSR